MALGYVDPRVALTVGAYAAANVALYGLLRQHYNDVCASSWFHLFLTEPSAYCQLVARALDVLKVAPLIAVGLCVAPTAGIPLL